MHIQQIVEVLSTMIAKVNVIQTELSFTSIHRSKDITDITVEKKEVINFCFYTESIINILLNQEPSQYSQQLFFVDIKYKETLKSFNEFNIIFVNNLYKSYALITEEMAKKPWNELISFSVTGTNGKTSTTWFIHQFLSLFGEKNALVNGEGFYLNRKKILSHSLTTPDVIFLQKYAQQALAKKYSSIVLEVSSHAIAQYRLASTKFDYLIFTNLSQDHLDYHKTMEKYFDSKKSLFLNYSKKDAVSIINIDCKYGKKLADYLEFLDKNVIRYGEGKNANYRIKYNRKNDGTLSIILFFLGEKFAFDTNLFCQIFASNLVASILVLYAYGYDFRQIKTFCNQIQLPVGRQEVFSTKKGNIVVDYAHTPEAMDSVLHSFSSFVEGKIIVVFGCGGDRDKKKRSEMGKIAFKYADNIILTDDNPRTENPDNIIEDIQKGGRGNELVIRERKQAIKQAMLLLDSSKDFLFILGKGAEEQQVYVDKIIPFSDREIVQQFIDIYSL